MFLMPIKVARQLTSRLLIARRTDPHVIEFTVKIEYLSDFESIQFVLFRADGTNRILLLSCDLWLHMRL